MLGPGPRQRPRTLERPPASHHRRKLRTASLRTSVKASVVLLIPLLLIDGAGSPTWFTHPAPKPVPTTFDGAAAWPSGILWESADIPAACSPGFDAQAITVAEAPRFGPDGCSQTWLIILPPTEGANLTSEMSYFWAHEQRFAGVIMDDFINGYGFDAPGHPWSGAYSALSSAIRVCPVVYDMEIHSEPAVLKGASCIVGAIEPSAGSVEEVYQGCAFFADALAQDSPGAKVLPLAYGAPFFLWRAPIPANYLAAMHELAGNMGAPEVLWN